MHLQNRYIEFDLSVFPRSIRSILEDCLLLSFTRESLGDQKVFYFTFLYKEQEYTLAHHTHYHGTGVTHLFKWVKPFFQKKPFRLSNQSLIDLTDAWMDIIYGSPLRKRH